MDLAKRLQAYTRTTGAYVQPAVGSTVVVSVASSVFAPRGLPVFIEMGGSYTVVDRIDAATLLLRNQGGAANAAPAVNVPSGKLLCPGPSSGKPSFNKLWVTQQLLDLSVFGFTPQQAISAPNSAPAVVITTPEIGPADGHPHRISCFNFNLLGDMWVGYSVSDGLVGGAQYVAKYSASKLVASGAVTPDFSFALSGAGIELRSGPNAILFDDTGGMWVAMRSSDTTHSGLLYYRAVDIAAPGSPASSRVIAQAGVVNTVNDITSDGVGGMWFSNARQSTVNRLRPDQLVASDPAIVPYVVLSFPAISSPYQGVSLDIFGNLWCSTLGFVDMFLASDILASGTPTPAVRISTTSNDGVTSTRLRFDRSNNLWCSTPTGPSCYPPLLQTATGAPAPACHLSGAGAFTNARVLNFSPSVSP